MRINAITVCVNYADLFSNSIMRWMSGCDRLLVVTTPEDAQTSALCAVNRNVEIHGTNAFTANGATFNKAAALVEAIQERKYFDADSADWCLFFDADIIPPMPWRHFVESARPTPGNLYGVHRIEQSTNRVYPDGELAGYFALAHATDPNMQKRPLLQTDWKHAGGYDSEFQGRWNHGQPWDKRVWLSSFTVMHVGQPGRNWWGRGDTAKMDQMLAERALKPGFDGERIK